MSDFERDHSRVIDQMLGFFDAQVLAAYRSEPNKYEVKTDFFEGRVTLTSTYYEELEDHEYSRNAINIQFGFRTLANGDLAIAAWLPDLFEHSKAHLPRWRGFLLDNPTWTEAEDERFNLWIKRYIEGSWEVENGPLSQLADRVETINGLSAEVLGHPLFKHSVPITLSYPTAQNDHRYQDAHASLYGYIIDGLNKEAIEAIAIFRGVSLSVNNSRTVKGLKQALPNFAERSQLWSIFDTISEQRRLAAHGVRSPAQRMLAFEKFTEDLQYLVQGLDELLEHLEQLTQFSAKDARKRAEARQYLPKIDRPAEPHYSIAQAPQMVGKTVQRVEYGFREEFPYLHLSEMLIIYFTDGSILSIDTGSNVGNLQMELEGFNPPDFHVDLNLQWVPPLKEIPSSEDTE